MEYVDTLTVERARALFHYDPETGVVTRLVTVRGRGSRAGRIFGTVNCDGYLVGQIDCQKYVLHRVIWLMRTGHWPSEQVDHKNLNRADNRWLNLRDAELWQNGSNKGAKSNTPSGLKGVYWHRKAGRWAAQIVSKKRHYYLGLFDDANDAHAVYAAKAIELHGEFARAA
jgi:hypothetical protein